MEVESVEKSEGLVEELELFIRYGVMEDERKDALSLLRRYRHDELALQLLGAFYRSLPEPHEEAARRIVLIEKKEDVFLLAVSTARHCYLYAATDQKALLLGDCGEDLIEPEVLGVFGYADFDALLARYPDISGCPEYAAVQLVGPESCPICSATTGEYHLLGCPVEVCPWCEGQLSRCNCRFERLGVEALDDEADLEELERLLEEKGRIPHAAWQCPSYPSDTDQGDGQNR